MNEASVNTDPEVRNKRPVFLSVLCILSFLGGGIHVLISLVTLAIPEKIIRTVYAILKEQQGPKTDELLDPMQAEMIRHMEEVLLANLIEHSKMYVLIGAAVSLILALSSIFGVARMWHQRKSGFWIYTVTNVLAIGGLIYLESWMGVVIALVFILMYALNLKHLK